jgi:hypothetical protein
MKNIDISQQGCTQWTRIKVQAPDKSVTEHKLTWIISIIMAKITFATSVKKLTLIGLN